MIKIFEVVFISTFIDNKNISTLLSSIVESNNTLKLLTIIVNQGNIKIDNYNSDLFNEFVEISITKTSLSHARNIGINYLIDNNIEFNHIMFPDDDSSFDQSFFRNFNLLIKPNRNYLIKVMGTGTNKEYKKIRLREAKLIQPTKYQFAMSVNMVICKDSLLNTQLFDENLGIGTINGAGEDADFFIRVCQHRLFEYESRLYNYHPLNLNKMNELSHTVIKERYKSYSRGYVQLIIKHNLKKDFFRSHFRTIAISIYYLFLLKPRMALLYLQLLAYRIQLMSHSE